MNESPRKKVCILGDGAVGKTTLTKRFLTGIFKEDYKLTIGMDFYVTRVDLKDKVVKLQIWDFAGEEKFRFLLPGMLHGAKGAIFMYDITRPPTFTHLKEWLEVYNAANKKHNQEVQALLVGGKLDLEEIRAVSQEKAKNFAQQNNLNPYIECSSKTGKNVKKVFQSLARKISKTEPFIKETR
jgi:small GTP-binding protein